MVKSQHPDESILISHGCLSHICYFPGCYDKVPEKHFQEGKVCPGLESEGRCWERHGSKNARLTGHITSIVRA